MFKLQKTQQQCTLTGPQIPSEVLSSMEKLEKYYTTYTTKNNERDPYHIDKIRSSNKPKKEI